MIHSLKFMKCSGAGNDFVLIDNMDGQVKVDQAALARVLCSRPFGVGADGLLVLEPSQAAGFTMRYFNADGSYGGMCGNGGRCIAMYALQAGYVKSPLTFEALDYTYKAELIGKEIRLQMKNPVGFRIEKELRGLCPGSHESPVFIDTGAPHLISRVSSVDAVDVQKVGRALRYHEAFSPVGTNVNFVQVDGPSAVSLRTYERGVEAETLACGTGSVASAVAAALQWGGKPPITVHERSGETLIVDFRIDHQNITNVSLQGSAHIVFRGKVFYDDSTCRLYGDQAE